VIKKFKTHRPGPSFGYLDAISHDIYESKRKVKIK